MTRTKAPGSAPFRSTGITAGLVLVALAACGQQTGGEADPSAEPPPASSQAAPVSGEVPPELIHKITAALSEVEALDRASITVMRAEAAVWPDGSMGCPKPGQMYTMAQVEGYRVVLQSAGKDYDYRVSSAGMFKRCRKPIQK